MVVLAADLGCWLRDARWVRWICWKPLAGAAVTSKSTPWAPISSLEALVRIHSLSSVPLHRGESQGPLLRAVTAHCAVFLLGGSVWGSQGWRVSDGPCFRDFVRLLSFDGVAVPDNDSVLEYCGLGLMMMFQFLLIDNLGVIYLGRRENRPIFYRCIPSEQG